MAIVAYNAHARPKVDVKISSDDRLRDARTEKANGRVSMVSKESMKGFHRVRSAL
jgi:hypothetical protein